MEGWYFKVAAPRGSFAFMYSIEDPTGGDSTAGVGAQVMGPGDTYMVQYTRDTRRFWGSADKLELGGTFWLGEGREYPREMLSEEEFGKRVQRGFQVSSEWHQGHLSLESQGVGGYIEPSVKECSWSYKTKRVHGWGSSDGSW